MVISDVMQKGVVSVSPELPIAELEAFLSSEEIGGAPVIDGTGKLVGVVSQTDIIRSLSEEGHLYEMLAPEFTVEDIMTASVLTVPTDADVKDVARQMVDARVHRVLIADEDGVCGIVTTFDLLRLLL
jgi:CBS domain-containing protein